jgi:hypothetical protein
VTAQPAGPRPSPVPVTERARKSPQAGTVPAGQYRPAHRGPAAALRPDQRPARHPGRQHRAQPQPLPGQAAPLPRRRRPHRRRSRTRDKGAARASRDAMTTVHDAPTDARTTPGPSLAKSRFRPCAPTRGPGANALISAECRSGKSGHQNSNDWPMVQPSRFVSIRKSCERAYCGSCRYLSAYKRICMPSGSRNPLTQPRGVSITGGCQMSSASRCSIH